MRKPIAGDDQQQRRGQVVHRQAVVDAEVAGGEPACRSPATARSGPASPQAVRACTAWSGSLTAQNAQQREQEGAGHRGAGDEVGVRPAQQRPKTPQMNAPASGRAMISPERGAAMLSGAPGNAIG